MTDKQKILVVDDLADWRATLSGLLEDAGYTVQVAESSTEALNLLESQRFDLAVLDMRLDETDEDNTEGLDLAADIKGRWPATKVVIVTGYGTPGTMRKAMEPDAKGRRLVDNYVPKTQAEDLIQIVQGLLES
jgi:CheY-like chemotaxis protein